jgi:2-polyprenyl-3-methyl-5-hydroxy-6-metoxy-1,4-benzoquinol methylase
MSDQTTDSEKVKSTFESYAKKFDGIYEPSERKTLLARWIDTRFRKSMYIRFEETLKNIDPIDIQSVLDIGCGSGRYAVQYLKMEKSVTGIDMAEEMIKLAEQTCQRDFPNGNAKFICRNYFEHPFNEKFDAAILMGVFDYIEDPARLLNKVKNETNKMILGSFPKSQNFLNSVRKIRYFLKGCPLYYHSKEDLDNLLRTCGFKNYQIIDNDREYFVKINLQAEET